MDDNSGKKLLNTFEKLGIDLGNCSPNVIEAWFDIDCSELKEFLNWISTTVTEENVIHAHQLDEYEENKRNNLVLSTDQYQTALDEVSARYPGIFDIEENELEIEFMEDELKILLEDEKKLDDIICLHENLHKKEKLKLAEMEKQKLRSIVELDKTEEECFYMCRKLDEVDKQLHCQLANCSEKLLEYEYPSTTTYISNIPLNKYTTHYQDIVSYFGLLDKKEYAGIPKLQSAVKTCSKLDSSVFRDKTDDRLNHLKEKLYKSIQNKNYKEAIKEQLQGELKFLEEFNIYELMHSIGSKWQLEANIQIKSDHYSILSLKLENLALEMSEKYIDSPSIYRAKKEVKLLQNKLDTINQVDNIFTSIFSYHTLLYYMLMINNDDILKSDQFFRSVHHYIADNLTNCELRMESMENIIKEYKLYQETPFKQKDALVQILLKLLSTDNIGGKSDVDLLDSFKNIDDCFESYKECFQFRNQVRLIEQNNKLLRNYLTNGPSSEFITFPFKVYEAFMEVDNILNTQSKVVTSCTEIWMDSVKQMSKDEWFKMKRQLWMYFIMQPQKMLSNIEKIKREIGKITVETM